MVKRLTYLSFYLFIYLSSKAQINLVPNPSFEDIIGNTCFTQMLVSTPSTSNNYLKNWYAPANTSSDYYNICANFDPGNPPPGPSTVPLHCFGYQYPNTGNAYVGIGVYDKVITTDTAHMYVEYVSIKLKNQLKTNTCYYGEFYANLSSVSGLVSNQIGLYLTQNIFTTTIGSFTNTIQPQIHWDTTKYFTDTLNWVKISGYFLAQGGEEHLTIGNFKDGAITKKIKSNLTYTAPTNCGSHSTFLSSYIYIDDVALYELSTPQIQFNAITICPNADTLVLGDTARIQTHYQWFANGLAKDTTSYIKVKPSQTTTYVLQSTNCTTTSQTIVVTYSNNCEPVVVVEPIIPNVFTPNNDSINDMWRFSLGKGNTLKDIAIFNRWGNLIHQKTNNLSQTTVLWDGRTTSGEETPNGVYFYVFQYTDANGDEHKKNGYITLIR
jgi:gliding motility-associated-like protein